MKSKYKKVSKKNNTLNNWNPKYQSQKRLFKNLNKRIKRLLKKFKKVSLLKNKVKEDKKYYKVALNN